MENAAALEEAEWITRLLAEVIDAAAWALSFAPLAAGIVLGAVLDGFAFAALSLAGLAATCGALAWVASRYGNGQSVGKRVMGAQVVYAATGEPLDWANNFLVRSFLLKFIIVNGIASPITSGIFLLINYLWPLWDEKRQAVHDKMMGTQVVSLR